ncbi:hypothetical protein DENIS_4575 [Desulfonema ishimotonii]|uniref:Uncharacterized protein n=1 Tax=Desulfonema ishimotonii TaxID=45657 RepID=A0A401G2X7_9BACT|nr:hypothetical protein [Desulfonema ishimotonii]GBC63577.1 hypothetical protein DENIS_4575 [Desulfonema ishimotonii]
MNMNCLYEKGYNILIGMVFLLVSFVFMGMGITVLPVIGFFIALPLAGLSVFFFTAPKSRECLMDD